VLRRSVIPREARCYFHYVNSVVDLSDPLVVSVSRRISASPHDVFEVLSNPQRHHEFDGSDMVRDSDASPIEAVGDAFVMRMHNDEFGDYEMRNEVVEYVQDEAISWAPKRHDVVDDEDWNHRWGWRLKPDGPATEVTAFFDCTRVPADGRRILRDGERWRPVLERSLERLEVLAFR
jgi:uncharacterized protein YndB with AHSA1/START domain